MQQRVDGALAFFGFERTGAIDHDTARLEQRGSAIEQARLQRAQLRQIALVLEPGDVGMAADRSGRKAGRIEQHGVERPAAPFGCVGCDDVGRQVQAPEIVDEALQPRLRAIDGGDVGAGMGKLPIMRSLVTLAYDCRLMNVAAGRSAEDALQLRDWLVESDARHDPQAHTLRPDVVLQLSEKIIEEESAYGRTRIAVLATVEELSRAEADGELDLSDREKKWLLHLQNETETLPEKEEDFIAEMLSTPEAAKFSREEYGL